MLEFAPIETGDLTEIPPDAPEGEWVAVCKPKPGLDKEGNPRIILEWTLEEAVTDGNADFVGSTVTDFFLVFYPARMADKSKRGRRQLRQVCDACEIEVPVIQTVTPQDVEELVQKLDGARARLWTRNKVNGNEIRTNIYYTAPGGVSAAVEVEEAPAPAPKGKAAPAKKAAGKGKKN